MNKNLPTEALLRQFNSMFSCKLKLDDKQIKLFEKNLLTEGLTRLTSIKFKNVVNLWLDYNNIYRIYDLATSSFERLKF